MAKGKSKKANKQPTEEIRRLYQLLDDPDFYTDVNTLLAECDSYQEKRRKASRPSKCSMQTPMSI